jgi:hypothetical protein
MSQATRTTGVGYTIFVMALAGSAICSVSGANGGDLGAPGYRPYPYGTLAERDGICRTLHERRIDMYEPAPSQFYSYPRPPAPIGPTYYN